MVLRNRYILYILYVHMDETQEVQYILYVHMDETQEVQYILYVHMDEIQEVQYILYVHMDETQEVQYILYVHMDETQEVQYILYVHMDETQEVQYILYVCMHICLPCPHIQFASGYDPRQLKEDREPCLMPNPVGIEQAVTLVYPSPLKQLEEEGSRKNSGTSL